MADLPPSSGADDKPENGSDGESSAGTPRWVYVFGIIAIILVLVFVVLHLTGHGLGGHMPL